MKDDREPNTPATIDNLVDAPITFAEAGITPGCWDLKVVDLVSMEIIEDATKVDCNSGLCWRWGVDRAHRHIGTFKLMTTPEALKMWKDQWK